MQSAHVIKNADPYYRSLLRGRMAWTTRDSRMADTLDLLAERLGRPGNPARVVVWAHNRHIGDGRATAMGDAGETTLGQMMRQRHPGEVALIGMTTYAGAVTCARGWGEPAITEAVPPGPPGSWEHLLHDSGFPRFYVTHGALRRTLGERAERLQRSIGAVYRPEAEHQHHYHRARLADEFDVVIHVDGCSATASLDPASRPRDAVGVIGGTVPSVQPSGDTNSGA
jgi:erythromycin esterase-like protein